jgi:diguanylate cyclase (GGDEF)-like protein
LVPYRLRTVGIAVQTTVAALVAMVLYAFLPGRGVVHGAGYATLIAVAAVGCFVMSRLPWRRLFDEGKGIRFLYLWSLMDIVLVTVAVAATGHGQSEMYLVYALTTVFFAASYPPRGQFALLGATIGCYSVELALFGSGELAAVVFIRITMIGLVGFMASFLSRELMQEMGGHVDSAGESEARAAMLAKVAGAARSMSTLDADRVLGVVVDAALELGFEGAQICTFDEDAGTWTSAVNRGLVSGMDATRPIDIGMAGEVRRQRQTVVVDDYASFPGAVPQIQELGFHATVACPVWSGSALVGVLVAGTRRERFVRDYERECLELLAAQAGAALINADRFVERRAFEERLHHQAFHDSLTGLPNRALFVDRLQHAQQRIERDGDIIAVLFLDIDRFKMINDSLGHDVGDALLIEVAGRLSSCLRPGDTLARYGGDEFTVLLEHVTESEAVNVAQRILDVLRLPFALGERDVYAGASVGIAYSSPGGGVDTDPLREADLAMYQAKERGRGRWEVFHPDMYALARGRLDNQTELARAIERRELLLHYQPIVSLQSGQVTGVEALVRWNHPRRGLVPPSEFIPLAEDTGLIAPLGQWVLEQACSDAANWEVEGVQPLQLHVNVSPAQFRMRELTGHVERTLRATNLPPERLTLEITESVVAEDIDAALAVMDELEAMGVQLALDDFGRGHSSLSSLKQYPLGAVKIDRAFVDGLAEHPEDRAIVRSVVMVAREMRMTVTAEGVETAEQLDLVRKLGCDNAQGFFLSAPLPAVGVPAAASPSVAALVSTVE